MFQPNSCLATADLPDVVQVMPGSVDEHGEPITPFSHPEKTQVALISAVKDSIDCKKTGMVIALQKMHLQVSMAY